MQLGPMSALAFSAILIASGVGCGEKSKFPETVPISGKVTYKGEPVTKGTITFQSTDGRTATGELQPDGTYHLSTFGENDGAVPGKHNVMIIASDADPTLMPGSSPGYKAPKDLIPKKYSDLAKSGLEAEVSRDKATHDFELK